MKILHIQSSSDTIGGQELSLLARLKVLRRHHVQNIVALPGPGKFAELLTKSGFRVIYLPVPWFTKETVVRYIDAVASLLAAVVRHKVNLIHCQGLYPAQLAVPVSKISNRRVIVNINNVNYSPYDYKRSFVRYADLIIGVSDACRRQVLDYVDIHADKVVKINNAIIEGDIVLNVSDVATARARCRITDTDVVVGQISQLIPIKGIEYFVRMAKIVRERHRNARFILVGAVTQGHDNYFSRIKGLISELGLDNDIVITGFQRDVYPYISLLDISVLCSQFEGLGRVLVESMQFKVPCVATDSGGSTEVVIDGRTGFLVPWKDPQAMADKVSYLIRHPEERARLGATGRDFVRDRFGYESHFAHLAEAYKRCNITISNRGSGD